MQILNLTEKFDHQIAGYLVDANVDGEHWINDVVRQKYFKTNQLKTTLVVVETGTTTAERILEVLVIQYLPKGNYGFLKLLGLNSEKAETDRTWTVRLIEEGISLLNKYANWNGHQGCYEIFSMIVRKPVSSPLNHSWTQQCKSLYSAGFRLIETEATLHSLPFLIYKPCLLPNFQVENGVKCDYIRSSVVVSLCQELRSVLDQSESAQREGKDFEAFARVLIASPKINPLCIRATFPWYGENGPSPETQVAVIGGGMAGLSAAASLSKAGFDVVLLEAANYLGGRVKQVQPFQGFAPVDLGGEFIHGSNTIVNKIAKENNWHIQPDCERHNEETIYYSGKLCLVSSDQPEVKAAREAWTEIIDTGIQHKPDLVEDDLLKSRLLKKGLSRDVIKIVDGWKVKVSAGSLEHYGVNEGRRRMETKYIWGGNNFRLAASYSQLVDYFLQQCEDIDKRLEWQIKEVVWKGKEDRESSLRGKVLIRNQVGDVLTAKYVVIAVPLTVLKDGDIFFVPDLPPMKKKAIDTFKMRGALKIVCRFRKHFWPDSVDQVYPIGGMVNEIWMYTRDSVDSDAKCHLIAGFATAETAEEKFDSSGQDVLKDFLKLLDEIFGMESNPHPASESFMDYVYYDWSKNPFVRGGYSSPMAHAYDLRGELAKPIEERVFFAGEATSLRSRATVPTAIETGMRVADEVCHAARILPLSRL